MTELTAACVNATADALPRLDISIDCDFESVTKDEWVNAKYRCSSEQKCLQAVIITAAARLKGAGTRHGVMIKTVLNKA